MTYHALPSSLLIAFAGAAAAQSAAPAAPPATAQTATETATQTATETVTTTAENTPTESTAEVLSAPETDRLRLTFTPYAWITSFSGDIEVRGVTIDATKSFVDILDSTDRVFGLMGNLDVVYDRLVFEFSGAWTTAEINKTRGIFDTGSVDANVEIDSYWFELFAGYRILDESLDRDDASNKDRFALDLFAGGRITALSLDTSLTSAVDLTLPGGESLSAGRTRTAERTEEWVEPFVGARARLTLAERWTFILRGDVGGFGVDDSDFSWQVQALAGYRWKVEDWDFILFGGYRAISQDYSNGDFRWDVITHGPVLGAAFSFTF